MANARRASRSAASITHRRARSCISFGALKNDRTDEGPISFNYNIASEHPTAVREMLWLIFSFTALGGRQASGFIPERDCRWFVDGHIDLPAA
jgi:hypothetical protein